MHTHVLTQYTHPLATVTVNLTINEFLYHIHLRRYLGKKLIPYGKYIYTTLSLSRLISSPTHTRVTRTCTHIPEHTRTRTRHTHARREKDIIHLFITPQPHGFLTCISQSLVWLSLFFFFNVSHTRNCRLKTDLGSHGQLHTDNIHTITCYMIIRIHNFEIYAYTCMA